MSARRGFPIGRTGRTVRPRSGWMPQIQKDPGNRSAPLSGDPRPAPEPSADRNGPRPTAAPPSSPAVVVRMRSARSCLMARYRGRHRAPSKTGRTIARTAVAGAVAGAPLLVAAPAANAAPDSAWDKLAQCESGGRWNINTGNGYHGGLQFSPRTWSGFGGKEFAAVAHQATREEQIVVAERVLAKQGWNAWPACSRKTGVRGLSATQRDAPEPKSGNEGEQIRLAAQETSTSGDYVVKRGDPLGRIAAANKVAG